MADENGNGVRITNREIYEEIRNLSKRVGRLEVAFFGILAAVGTALGRLIV